LIQKKNQWFDK